jgi:hypothetical protein
MMATFLIRYALGGGFGGCESEEWEEIEAKDLDAAEREAYERACELYESYAGMHGLRDEEQIMEEDEVSAEEAQEIYNDERESWLDFEAKPAEETK